MIEVILIGCMSSGLFLWTLIGRRLWGVGGCCVANKNGVVSYRGIGLESTNQVISVTLDSPMGDEEIAGEITAGWF